jgi:hypothetical protein
MTYHLVRLFFIVFVAFLPPWAQGATGLAEDPSYLAFKTTFEEYAELYDSFSPIRDAKQNAMRERGKEVLPQFMRYIRDLPKGRTRGRAIEELVYLKGVHDEAVAFVLAESAKDPDEWLDSWAGGVVAKLSETDPAVARTIAKRILAVDRYGFDRGLAYTYLQKIGTVDDLSFLEDLVARLQRNPIPSDALVNVDVVEGEKVISAIKTRLALPTAQPVNAGLPSTAKEPPASTKPSVVKSSREPDAPLAQVAPDSVGWEWWILGAGAILALGAFIVRSRRVG